MMAVRWRKAIRSGTTNCIELAFGPGAVRDSKNPTGPNLPANLRALLTAVKSGRLDRA